MAYDIPENMLVGLKALLELDIKDLETMEKVVSSETQSATPANLVDAILEQPPASSFNTIRHALTALVSLQIAKDSWAQDDPKFLDTIFEPMKTSGDFAHERIALVKATIERIQGCKGPLPTTAKAFELLRAQPVMLQDMRIFSDIRTVFGADESLKPPLSVLFHTLRMECATSDGNQTFYFAATDGVLAALKSAIERAETKSKVLREVMNATGIECLEI